MSRGRGSDKDGKLSLETAEKLYQKAPCGYISFQRDGRISNLNETLLSWLGYQREEVVDVKKVQELLKIGARIYFETHFFPLLKMQGFVKEINLELQRKDKSSFPGLLNVIEVKDEDTTGEVTYWATIFDISDRKGYEKELLKAKQKAEAETLRAEAERQKAEAAQQRAESERQKAEAAWKRTEAEKQKAEAAQQTAEAERKKAETEKQKAEAAWKRTEAEKQKAEAAQQTAETERKKAETEKQKAEAAWKRTEAEKQKAETAQQTAEAERKKAETEKQKAEAAWKRTEAEKQKAEAAQQTAETERKKAETEKQKAEAAQQTAETERKKAEAEKQKAETAQQRTETEKQKAEAAQQRAEEAFAAKARFLATISHEIRTPLNAILGIGNLFHKTSLDEQQKEYARILQLSSENLLELVNNVLDLSKIESGKVKLVQKPFVLSEVVEGVTRTLEVKATEKSIELLSQLGKEVPPYLIGDPGKLNQVLTNLVGNAIKFTEEGGVYLEVSTKAREGDRVLLRFSVLDTGIGIPSDKLETVFGEFSQADYDVKEQYGGTGLGLTISQKLLELQDSRMQVKSELGQGAEFSFEIWYREGDASQHEEAAVKSLPKEFKTARLLVVDDNPVNIYILGEFLQEWNLTYDSVESGQEAIDAVQKFRYDLLLMDLHMPAMNGYQASEAIRQLELSRQPVIMALSASAQGEVSEKLREAGMNDYVSKPFRPSELLDRLAHHLRQPEPEKFSFIPSSESPPPVGKDTSAEVAAPKGFGVSRILKITGGRKDPLLKMLKTTAHAIEGYETEFGKALEKRDAKALRALIHKSTMTLYYAEADILKGLLEEVATGLEEKRTDEEIAESSKKTFSEFARLHEALGAVDVQKLLREDVD